MAPTPIHTGTVGSLCVNGLSRDTLDFRYDGPAGDRHSGIRRDLDGHDGAFIRSSSLSKGDRAFNWRTWTAVSKEDLEDVAQAIGANIPQGCLLENMTIRGIPNFSKLPIGSRLVFPHRDNRRVGHQQAILAVWEQNMPCKTVGQRLAKHYGDFELMTKFVAAAKDKRGVMGFVLTSGPVMVGDTVLVYPPT